MDENFKAVLDSLAEKKPRSRLEPYAALIDALRRRGRTYREIARILAENCAIKTSRSTINDFVRSRSRPKRNPDRIRTPSAVKSPTANPGEITFDASASMSVTRQGSPNDDLQKRITALKQRPTRSESVPTPFNFDPNEPLRLPPDDGKDEKAE